jgi:hypothetical protein
MLGMVPLLFIDTKQAASRKREDELLTVFDAVVQEVSELLNAGGRIFML